MICDRFIDSTRVYQGEAGGLPGEVIDTLNDMVVSPTFPDLTIILDMPAELGLGRAHSRRVDKVNPGIEADAYEKRDLPSTGSCARRSCDIAAAEPERCVLIDARPGERDVIAAVWAPSSAAPGAGRADGTRACHGRDRGAAGGRPPRGLSASARDERAVRPRCG